MLDKDNADIKRRQAQMEQNRAEKARAKAEGNYGRQAYESMAIGANKAAIKGNKVERYVDQKMVEEDREDLREARAEERNANHNSRRYNNQREMSPAAGKHSTFWGMASVNDYPTGRPDQQIPDSYEYWQGKHAMNSSYDRN